MRISRLTPALLVLAAGASIACADGASLEYIGQGIGITDMSYDGSVAVGNTITDGVYETWRWVQGDPNGWQRLGQATVPVLGTGAGLPGVSYDGTRVSATILGPVPESRGAVPPYATSGIWTEGQGWTELIPPLPTDCINLDNGYASAWGLSGDGTTVSGFYWNDNPSHGSAWPCFSSASGTIGLSAPLDASGRVNAVNYDATVGVGWTEDPFGAWMPTVWRDGTYTWIVPDLGPGQNPFAEAYGVNADGSVIVGQIYNTQAARLDPARWVWNGSSYDVMNLGVLPGTPQTFIAQVWANSVSDDGDVVVGMNQFVSNGPFSNQTGFVWTPQDGIRDIVAVLADYGLALPPDYRAVGMEVSPDGSAIGITALNPLITEYFDYHSYIFRYPSAPPPACAGDLDGDGDTTVLDFSLFAANFGTSGHDPYTDGDFDGDGAVTVLDFALFAADFGCVAN